MCLITGSVEGVLRIHEFIMEKIKEKPDPTAKIAIDFDHKQPAEREKQVGSSSSSFVQSLSSQTSEHRSAYRCQCRGLASIGSLA